MERPVKWEGGLLADIPRHYLEYVVDLPQQQQIRTAAIWQLQVLAREEVERNQLLLNPNYPILDRLTPIWKHELQSGSYSPLLNALGNIGPKAANFAPELKIIFAKLAPGTGDWVQCSQALAETRDPELVPAFVRFAGEPNSTEIRTWSLYALAKNGCTNVQVAPVLRPALISTNEHLRTTAVFTWGYLQLCIDDALQVIEKRRNEMPNVSPSEIRMFDPVEPVLRWRGNTNDEAAANWIHRNLAPEASPHVRLRTAELLGRIGPEARRFVPVLATMAQERWPMLQGIVIDALRAIDPREANQALATIQRNIELQVSFTAAKH
jgi:hypothetical protein